eukprot:5416404-Pyramimonas_sp.AAC.2
MCRTISQANLTSKRIPRIRSRRLRALIYFIAWYVSVSPLRVRRCVPVVCMIVRYGMYVCMYVAVYGGSIRPVRTHVLYASLGWRDFVPPAVCDSSWNEYA